MKKVLIISSSPRIGGNSDILAERFQEGAKKSGNEVELIHLAEKKIGFCHGCYYCADHDGHCCQKDDAEAIVDKMIAADVIVLATPTYFYSMSAQLKCLIDRSVMKYTRIQNKDLYYLVTSWDSDPKHLDKVVEAIRGFSIDCLEGTKEKGVILAPGCNERGEAKASPAYNEAYEAGLKC